LRKYYVRDRIAARAAGAARSHWATAVRHYIRRRCSAGRAAGGPRGAGRGGRAYSLFII